MNILRAPFPYYGYKGAVSADVWARLGNPGNYVEPFFGSGAVLLQRPTGGGREVINDKYGHVVNFWRSVQADPDAVAAHAVTRKAESNLHARNSACRRALDELTQRLECDPEYCDPKLAGWWCYVQCEAIGEAAFADGPWVQEDGKLVRRPKAKGVRRSIPCDARRGIQKSIPFHGKQGIMARRETAGLWMRDLHDRLDGVIVLCGDWSRALKPTFTTQHGITGVFIDPPYATHYDLYANSNPMLDKVYSWCLKAGKSKKFRIALCYYEGTLPGELPGWSVLEWKASGGRITTGGSSDENRKLERIAFSPHCNAQQAEQLLIPMEAV